MTTSRFDVVSAMIDDLLSDESEWWDAELETITGATRQDFRALLTRAKANDFVPDKYDRFLLRAAANNLIGYPEISTVRVSRTIRSNWIDEVSVFLRRSD